RLARGSLGGERRQRRTGRHCPPAGHAIVFAWPAICSGITFSGLRSSAGGGSTPRPAAGISPLCSPSSHPASTPRRPAPRGTRPADYDVAADNRVRRRFADLAFAEANVFCKLACIGHTPQRNGGAADEPHRGVLVVLARPLGDDRVDLAAPLGALGRRAVAL